jgi:hypothetical protein
MRHHTPGLTFAGIAALLLAACSGGGGGSNGGGGGTNTPPVANAGVNQTVTSGVTVTLNGTASNDADGSISTYAWTQSAGTPAVTLANAATSQPTFPAPTVTAASTLTFSLVVTDNRGAASTASTVNVTVNPAVAGTTNVTGRVTFARVPFATTAQDPDRGLNYANPEQQPARGVVVRAIDATTQATLVSGVTDSQGDYSLAVASNTSITIRVVAQMLRGGAAPNWDVRVQDGVSGTPYDYTEPGSFNSSSGTAHDIAIPTGINASGVATGARASGPFAVLDTIYQGIETILGVAPATNFPALIVDWGSQADGTFFQSGSTQRIALLSDLAADTDEFDQHVIAHEFGHYIEYNFSRADNIGGSHSLGDKLDARVAFGEGFGYAFAAIVRDDPVARDSAKDGGNFFSGSFNFETNPPSNPAGAINGNYGCWCSESSVWAILWDIYDSAADTNDSVALGFSPIWNVLIADQRVTPAFTTIFSFVTALKAQSSASAAAINTLVAAQNIDAATIDAYGTNETHAPNEVPAIAALPVYATATIGGPSVVLRNVDDEGRYNKLGNRRYVRFNVPTTQTITITASSSNPNNPDTDFLVYRAGTFVRAGTDPPSQNPEVETFSATAGDYVLDVYDCANGCSDEEGTPGDYNLTVTIN